MRGERAGDGPLAARRRPVDGDDQTAFGPPRVVSHVLAKARALTGPYRYGKARPRTPGHGRGGQFDWS